MARESIGIGVIGMGWMGMAEDLSSTTEVDSGHGYNMNIYKRTKKGKLITTIGTTGELEGMPVNTLKKAISTGNKDQYIKVSAYISGQGRMPVEGFSNKTQIKPKVEILVQVYGKDKKLLFKKEATLDNFASLRSVTRTRGAITRTKSETLSPVDIVMMYEMALEEALKTK